MAESVWWDEEFDVVVVGAGGAGLIAAVEAAGRGASVLVVEKQSAPGGGATGMCVGSITAAGTEQQRAAGIDDNVEAHCRTLEEMAAAYVGWEWDLDLARLMAETAPLAVARLTELGVRFSGPHPEVPHPVYRMLNVVPGPEAYVEVLSRRAGELGVEIRCDTAVEELARDEDGAVSILALRHGRGAQTRTVRARRAVVLAAGDFSANDALGRKYGRPPEVSAIPPLQPNATGDGHLLGASVGADSVAMERTGWPNFRTVLAPYVQPDPALFREGAVLVNLEGRRYTDELARPEVATQQQPRQQAYIVFDARLAARTATAADDSPVARDGWYRTGKPFLSTFPEVAYAYLEDFARAGFLFEANTAAELAARVGLPAVALERTLTEYTATARAGGPDAFGRAVLGPGVSEAPFYAVGPIRPVLVFSSGGLRVDRSLRVLDEAGLPIPHLYACGANAEAGVFLGGHGHHLSWAFGSGMIAGRAAVAAGAAAVP